MINWYTKKFTDLTPHELYAILRLRTAVFVVEQNCVFQDMDNKDQQCLHLMGWEGEQLAACSRLVPPGISYDFPSIGRVVTSPVLRSTGIGKALMQKSIDELVRLYGKTPICIGAQLYLRGFYESFGFAQSGKVYDEDGINHLEMTRP
jgi:ElaA protein